MIEIPELGCPFPSRISPHAEAAERQVRAYLRRFDLLRSPAATAHYDETRFGELNARIYPDAELPELLLITDWIAVWAIFDDQLEKLPDTCELAAVDHVIQTALTWLPLSAGASPPAAVAPPAATAPPSGVETPFGAALSDLWSRMTECTSRAWRRRFVAHVEEYLEGCRWEAERRRTKQIPEFGAFVARRRQFGGIRMAMDLAELGGRYELPDELHADPVLQDLVSVLGDITLWGNDLFSLTVDHEEGNVSNILFVLQHRDGGTLQDAAALVSRMLEERLQAMLALEGELLGRCDQKLTAAVRRDLGRYIDGMHTWISGNLDWSRGNERYRTARHRVTDLQPNFLLELATSAPTEGLASPEGAGADMASVTATLDDHR